MMTIEMLFWIKNNSPTGKANDNQSMHLTCGNDMLMCIIWYENHGATIIYGLPSGAGWIVRAQFDIPR